MTAKTKLDKEKCKLILGDCLEEMKKLPDESVDLVITSPPFSDEDVPDEDYYIWFGKILDEVRRISKIVFIFNSSKRLVEICKRFNPDRVLIWDKKRTKSAYRYEPIFCWKNDSINLNKYIWNDCLAYLPIVGKEQKTPFQNPTKPYELLIKFFRNDVKIILDPFMGSGTTGVAALKLQIRFVGIEINHDYFEIAKKRIEPWLKQERLFNYAKK